MMNEIKECKFCKGTSFKPHSTAKYWENVKLNFVECENCGLIFTNPMPGMDIVSRGNRAYSILHKYRGTISQYRGGKDYAFTLKRKAKTGKFLDIGCAEGIFLKGIEENSNWQAEGLDIIEKAVEFANDVLKIKVHLGTLETFDARENYYDYVRMNNVIEHIQDPVLFLEKTNKIMKQGGTVYCSTPNGVQDGAVLKTANKQGYDINLQENHFYYYPPKTLRKIFEHCGFKIVHAYSEDISHSLSDFGITSGLKKPPTGEKFSLEYYDKIPDYEFSIDPEEVKEYKTHSSAKSWKVLLNKYRREIFRFRFPYFMPVGHQQHIYAKKI